MTHNFCDHFLWLRSCCRHNTESVTTPQRSLPAGRTETERKCLTLQERSPRLWMLCSDWLETVRSWDSYSSADRRGHVVLSGELTTFLNYTLGMFSLSRLRVKIWPCFIYRLHVCSWKVSKYRPLEMIRSVSNSPYKTPWSLGLTRFRLILINNPMINRPLNLSANELIHWLFRMNAVGFHSSRKSDGKVLHSRA